MVAHGACSLLVKLLDMKMWDGFLIKYYISSLVCPDLRIYHKFSFITASGFSRSKEFSCMAGTPWSNGIRICLPMRQARILIVFVIADDPSTILSLPTSLSRQFVFSIHSGKYIRIVLPHQWNHLDYAVGLFWFVVIDRSHSVAVISFGSNHDCDILLPSNASSLKSTTCCGLG